AGVSGGPPRHCPLSTTHYPLSAQCRTGIEVGMTGELKLLYCVDGNSVGAGSGLRPGCVGLGIVFLTPSRLLIVFTYPFCSIEPAVELPTSLIVAADRSAAAFVGLTTSLLVSIGLNCISPAVAGPAATNAKAAAVHSRCLIRPSFPRAAPERAAPHRSPSRRAPTVHLSQEKRRTIPCRQPVSRG